MLSIRSPDLIDTPVSKKSGLRSVRRQEDDMLSVTVTHNDTSVTVEAEGTYSPDLIDDLCRRASSTLAATLVQLLAALGD